MKPRLGREQRPTTNRALNPANQPGGLLPILLRDALADLADPMGWYESGVMHGVDIGRQQIVNEWRGQTEAGAAVARMIAQHGPYDELAERRGQPERAAAQRAILRDRGIA